MIKKGNYFLMMAALLLVFYSCDDSELANDVPNCIETKISFIKKEPVRNPPAKVWKWEVDSKTYYYITSDCCDQFNFLYDENCMVICAPDGGITGMGDGNCPIFNGEIKKTLVWEDKRN